MDELLRLEAIRTACHENEDDFIAELVRAANEIHALTPSERVRLIERAATTIQAQRDLLITRQRVVPLPLGVTADLEKMKHHASELPGYFLQWLC